MKYKCVVLKVVVSKMTSLSHALKIDLISFFKDPGEVDSTISSQNLLYDGYSFVFLCKLFTAN